MARRRGLRWVLALILSTIAIGAAFLAATPQGQVAYRVLDFRLRRAWVQRFGEREIPQADRGSLLGRVTRVDGEPLSGAVVVVSGATGRAHAAVTGPDGAYALSGVPAGRYVPVAAAWGFELREGPVVRIRAGRVASGIDFALSSRTDWPSDPSTPVTITARTVITGTFPEPDVAAERIDFAFRRGGLLIDVDSLYLPPGAVEPLPTLVMIFPSDEPHWDPAAVAFSSQGFAVLSVKPALERGWLDIDGHAADAHAAATLLASGRLTLAADLQRVAWLAGSFSTLFMYMILPEHPEVRAIITVGGISDAFLGAQALYDESLEIPDRFRLAVTTLGRPDRDPAVFMRYSPAFFAPHMPPTLVVHTTADRVIPYSQSVRFAEALTAAGMPHELILYEDTTHYLNTVNPTPATMDVYWRMVAFLRRWLGDGGD